eukprot:COSAG03_NODE_29788_length_177_cov_10.833333_1_plen_33_part_01
MRERERESTVSNRVHGPVAAGETQCPTPVVQPI